MDCARRKRSLLVGCLNFKLSVKMPEEFTIEWEVLKRFFEPVDESKTNFVTSLFSTDDKG